MQNSFDRYVSLHHCLTVIIGKLPCYQVYRPGPLQIASISRRALRFLLPTYHLTARFNMSAKYVDKNFEPSFTTFRLCPHGAIKGVILGNEVAWESWAKSEFASWLNGELDNKTHSPARCFFRWDQEDEDLGGVEVVSVITPTRPALCTSKHQDYYLRISV